MKTKILLFNLFLLIVSCKAQTTYSDEILEKQSEKITKFQQQQITKRAKSTVGDIINNLDFSIISFGLSAKSWEDGEVINQITLRFNNDFEAEKKINSKKELHNIYIYIF